jgi:flagellar hook assembly protein FlgD
MRLPRALFLVVALTLLAAAPATADVRMLARDEPVGALAREHAARPAPLRFDLVGLHWRGSGSVWFRTRSVDGAWSPWQPARPEAEDAPDRGTREARAAGRWKLGNPYWTGDSDAIDYRLAGRVTALRAYFIRSPVLAAPSRSVLRAARPSIITRAQWGADESIVRAPPYYADRVRFAVVHHTAGTNSYTASQSAAIVRGIQRYHVLANGWNDIGYNFLVDKYGQVFEGRGGGLGKNVVGAHAEGFNTGSTGVSVLGTYSSSKISSTARSALVKLLAWRLDVAHVDATSRLKWVSGGNPEYPAGTVVSLRAIAGHRDTGPTSCPGAALYGQLPGIRTAVAARGGPKLYDPEVTGSLGGPVRVTGRLSTALGWLVTIRAADGSTVATGTASGTRVDWTWDASAHPFGNFTYTVSAGPDVRPWTARVPGPPPLEIQRLRAAPRVLTPNGDGVRETTTISFSLTTAAKVTAEIVDGSGTTVRHLVVDRSYPTGRSRLRWAGRTDAGSLVPDANYSLELSAQSPGQSDSASRTIVVDRTLGFLVVTPSVFSPNGDGREDVAHATFTLARPARVRVLVMHADRRIATIAPASDLPSGQASFGWDGLNRYGRRAAERRYRVRVEATTALGTRILSRYVRLDVTPPRARILSASTDGVRTRVRITVDEEALLRVRFGTSPAVLRDVTPGTHVVSKRGAFRIVRVRAVDRAENAGELVRARVRRA